MGVDGDAGDAIGIAQDDIRGLASDSWQGDEILESIRYLTVELFADRGGHTLQALRLGAEEPRRADDLLELGRLCGGDIRDIGIAVE